VRYKVGEADGRSSKGLDVVVRETLQDVIRFVCAPEFQSVVEELYGLPREERARFVESVLLNEGELKSRGIVTPEGLIVQRSVFGDGRPTLFCVSKLLPAGYLWHKATVTFDSEGMTGSQAY
jgi:hypothetical protein